MAWTDAQRQAIDIRGKNLLVSAAAGSGKTAVLVQRIADIIVNEKVDVQSLLIVTFTNLAAAEMKERIENKLIDVMEEAGSDNEYLRRQIQNLPRASISTMHSFCMDIIRRNFHIIDIDPSFKIANQASVQLMKTQAIEQLFEEYYEQEDEGFLSLVDAYGGSRDDSKLMEIILRTHSFIQSQPYPLRWLSEQAAAFDINEEEFEDTLWARTIKDDIRLKLEGTKEAAKEAIRISLLPKGPAAYIDALQSDIELTDQLEKALERSLSDFYQELSSASFERLKTISKKAKEELDEGLIERVKSIRNSSVKKDGIDALKKAASDSPLSEQIAVLKEIRPLMEALYRAVAEFDRLYRQEKMSDSVLDFADLEHFALEILEHSEVRESLKNRYSYIFFDEYQDSNIVQETILNAVKKTDNVFMVGDVKQSIYRFRLADPTLFIEKYQRYAGDSSAQDMKLDLSSNFRSRGAILHTANYIFKRLMSRDLGEIEYDEAAMLIPGMDFPPEKDKVQIAILENTKDSAYSEFRSYERSDDEDEKPQSPQFLNTEDIGEAQLEALYTASKIKELVKKTWYDPKEKTEKPINYSDIVILMRSPSGRSKIFSEVFVSQGIPVYIDYSQSYYDVLEIKLFIDFLKLIDNIQQDEPLISVMTSVIGGFETEDLIRIRINDKKSSLYNAIISYMDEQTDEISEKLRKFISMIEGYAFLEKLQKLDEFIWQLMSDTGYYGYISAMPGGEVRQQNLDALIEKAAQFQQSSAKGLFNFLRYVDKLLRDKGDTLEPKALTQMDNVVRIMSIHKSKGLEFPVVFVCGLAKQFNKQDFRQDIMLHTKLGLGPKYVNLELNSYNDSIAKTAIKIISKNELLSEELRILYVAITRAIDTLVLVGTVNSLEKAAGTYTKSDAKSYLMSRNDFLSWIMIALSKHRDAQVLADMAGRDYMEEISDSDDSDWETEASFKLELLRKSDILSLVQSVQRQETDIKKLLEDCDFEQNEDIMQLAEERFSYEYPFLEDTSKMSKISATALAKNQIQEGQLYREEKLIYPEFEGDFAGVAEQPEEAVKSLSVIPVKTVPRFMQGKVSFSAAQKGTIMHFVMQSIDIHNVSSVKNVEDQLDMMQVNELLTDEERETVNAEAIYRFFQTELGKRLIESSFWQMEESFMLKDEGIIVSGIIDCWFMEDGEAVIIDYKTDSVRLYSKEQLAQRYTPQISIYAQALSKSRKLPVKAGYIYLFDINEFVRIL